MKSLLKQPNLISSDVSSKKKVLGLDINDIDYDYLYHKISSAINFKEKFVINYANAHTARFIKKDPRLMNALMDADLVHSDGIGIWAASRLLKNSTLRHRFNFTDYSIRFLNECQINGWSLFILGGSDDILALARKNIKEMFPRLKLTGTMNGYENVEMEGNVRLINESSPDILWVGMGTPKQELWVYSHKKELECNVVQCVGDLITFLAGKKARGPLIVRQLGFEWLVRLSYHPLKYFDRYVIGIPVFIYLLMKEILFPKRKLFKKVHIKK
jgi:N-acetylglucosaminyldiphosphoundecaprenol N-acetyl-beta-D-mannosaminyltransferase